VKEDRGATKQKGVDGEGIDSSSSLSVVEVRPAYPVSVNTDLPC